MEMQQRSGEEPMNHCKFTHDERNILTHFTNLHSKFAAAAADPVLRRYLDWYIAHLRTRLDEATSRISVISALRPHLSNTAEVDQGLMHILALVSQVLIDKRGGQSMRRIYESLLGVQKAQMRTPTADEDDSDS